MFLPPCHKGPEIGQTPPETCSGCTRDSKTAPQITAIPAIKRPADTAN